MTIPAPDGTLSNLDLAMTPLTVPYVFGQNLSTATAIGFGVTTTVDLAEFRMPFYGDVIYQGWVRMVLSPGIQQVDIRVDPLGAPAPAFCPYAQWRTEGGAGDSITMMPILASWGSVAPTTLVDINLVVANGYGSPGLQIDNYFGVAYCTKT